MIAVLESGIAREGYLTRSQRGGCGLERKATSTDNSLTAKIKQIRRQKLKQEILAD